MVAVESKVAFHPMKTDRHHLARSIVALQTLNVVTQGLVVPSDPPRCETSVMADGQHNYNDIAMQFFPASNYSNFNYR